MKYVVLISFFFITLQVDAQIAIDEPTEKKIVSTPYDGSFMRFPPHPSIIKEDVAYGMIGEKVTFIKMYPSCFRNEDGSAFPKDKLIGKNYYVNMDNFKNKTFEIIGYEKKYGRDDYFTVKNETGTYIWKVGILGLQHYVFNKFLDTIEDKLLNQVFIPFHNSYDCETLDGTKITINGKEEYKVTRVSYAKFSENKYGIKVQLNEKLDLIYPTGEFDQPLTDKIEGVAQKCCKSGWINLKGGITLIEKSEYEKFKVANSKFLDKIRANELEIGMNYQQVVWSLGTPERLVSAYGEYDEIYDWYLGRKLFFKNKILVKIQ
jgi:hypothetical protein